MATQIGGVAICFPHETRNTKPVLYPFSPILRCEQRQKFLSCQSPQITDQISENMIVMHVIAGTLYPPIDLNIEIFKKSLSLFLQLSPCPNSKDSSKVLEWRQKFENNEIKRDGFIKKHVGKWQFSASPSQHLQEYLINGRHLGRELPTSVMGKYIGASQISSFF